MKHYILDILYTFSNSLQTLIENNTYHLLIESTNNKIWSFASKCDRKYLKFEKRLDVSHILILL